MNLTNDSYIISISTKSATERYYRDKSGWVKVSTRGRTFRATAEQVLNRVLPALAGIKRNVTIKVEHHEPTQFRIREVSVALTCRELHRCWHQIWHQTGSARVTRRAERPMFIAVSHSGGVAEWSNAAVLKTATSFGASWVRIPPPPLIS